MLALRGGLGARCGHAAGDTDLVNDECQGPSLGRVVHGKLTITQGLECT